MYYSENLVHCQLVHTYTEIIYLPTPAGNFVNGEVILRIDQYSAGPHNLTVVAFDQFGNIASEVYTFITPPEGTICIRSVIC